MVDSWKPSAFSMTAILYAMLEGEWGTSFDCLISVNLDVKQLELLKGFWSNIRTALAYSIPPGSIIRFHYFVDIDFGVSHTFP